MSRAIVVVSMAAWSRSSPAARADSAQPSTGDAAGLPGLARRVERERLAGPGRRPHDLDAVFASGQRRHELSLLARSIDGRRASAVVERAPRSTAASSGRCRCARSSARARSRAARACCSGARRPPARARRSRRARGTRPRGDSTLATVAPSRACSANACSDVAARERRPVAREPVRPFQPLGQIAAPSTSPLDGAVAGSTQRGAVEAVLGRARPPLLPQPVDGDAVLLAPPRLERRHLRGARRASRRARAMCSRISARRCEKCSITRRGTPSTSAVPCSTGLPRAARARATARPAARPGRGSRRSSRAGTARGRRAPSSARPAACVALATTTCVCSSGSPAREERCRNAAATKPRPGSRIAPPCAAARRSTPRARGSRAPAPRPPRARA